MAIEARDQSNVQGSGHQTKNAYGLQKIEKKRKWILLQNLQKESVL